MNTATKHLIDYAGYATATPQLERLVRLTVNDVLGVLYQQLHPQAYAQVLRTIQDKYSI